MVCNKCGRPVSSRLSKPIPLCMRCRYQAARSGPPSIAKKIKPRSEKAACIQCGKEILNANSRKLYCDHCKKYRRKRCAKCGAEFEVKITDYSTRDFCWECKPKFDRSGGEETAAKKQKALRRQKAAKMRAIKASGLTYGQYMAAVENGLPAAAATEQNNEPPKKEEAPEAASWRPLGEYEKPKVFEPKARLKIPVSRLPYRGEPTRSCTGPRRQCAAWNL